MCVPGVAGVCPADRIVERGAHLYESLSGCDQLCGRDDVTVELKRLATRDDEHRATGILDQVLAGGAERDTTLLGLRA